MNLYRIMSGVWLFIAGFVLWQDYLHGRHDPSFFIAALLMAKLQSIHADVVAKKPVTISIAESQTLDGSAPVLKVTS